MILFITSLAIQLAYSQADYDNSIDNTFKPSTTYYESNINQSLANEKDVDSILKKYPRNSGPYLEYDQHSSQSESKVKEKHKNLKYMDTIQTSSKPILENESLDLMNNSDGQSQVKRNLQFSDASNSIISGIDLQSITALKQQTIIVEPIDSSNQQWGSGHNLTIQISNRCSYSSRYFS